MEAKKPRFYSLFSVFGVSRAKLHYRGVFGQENYTRRRQHRASKVFFALFSPYTYPRSLEGKRARAQCFRNVHTHTHERGRAHAQNIILLYTYTSTKRPNWTEWQWPVRVFARGKSHPLGQNTERACVCLCARASRPGPTATRPGDRRKGRGRQTAARVCTACIYKVTHKSRAIPQSFAESNSLVVVVVAVVITFVFLPSACRVF